MRSILGRACLVAAAALGAALAARAAAPPSAAPAASARPAEAESLRLAIADLVETFGDRYPRGRDYLARLATIETSGSAADLEALRQEALLSNPLLDFGALLLVNRGEKNLGLPANWQGNSSLPKRGFDNELAVLSPVRPDGELRTLYRPDRDVFVGDVDLDWDAGRLLFSSVAADGRWQVFEIGADGGGLRQVTAGDEPDVDNYDPCYLPDGRILFTSSACMTGVPCVRGSDHVANLYLLGADGRSARRLCFDQDHNWCPTVLPTGRILYTRWEYCDLPHAFSRLLFHMNPDGTEQMEYYGSNSYWPNSIFYARPVPGHPTKVVGIVTGHHGAKRAGELVIFDPARSRTEAGGAVQRIPGRGKPVQPVILDQLADASWPKFLHPWPLSEKYLLVAAQPSANARWGVYLADVFDNLVLVKELPGRALLEPVPLAPRPRPPVIPDKVDPARRDALVYLVNVYAGGGLKGVPRATIRQLRLFTYHYAYHGMGGQLDRVGLDGPWDVKRILGTVPVQEDGSAYFRVPANTPIAVQPLDADGKAVQLMRSWFTGMPGENVSCVGCHEKPSQSPPPARTLAIARPPDAIQPWHGPPRGFDFDREVQPVLDRYCVGCHDGGGAAAAGTPPANKGAPPAAADKPDFRSGRPALKVPYGFSCSPSYYALRRYVRGPTMEGDLHMLEPWEFHADTTRLVRMLRQGHHGAVPDAEAWDRLITWIDLNTPAHGTWHDICGMDRVAAQRDRRRALDRKYAGLDEDPEAVPPPAPTVEFVAPRPERAADPTAAPPCPGWPFDAAEARRRQASSGPVARTIDLGSGVTMDLVRIPAGEFVMGAADPSAPADERPPTRLAVVRPFWIGRTEVTNEQFARFDPTHDSRLEHGHFLHFSVRERGYPVNGPRQPVVRISWERAMAFCQWLSARTGAAVTLPTEAQWEYACRAGADTPLWYGTIDTDHGRLANLADATINRIETLGWGLPSGAIPPYHPTLGRFDDKARVSADVGTYEPNAWGLHDAAGNVAEWTRTAYRPYPYREDDGRDAPGAGDRVVVRGGSWYDRPKEARSAFRQSYPPYQAVFDVGFRVAGED